jgi:hypothetical protein
MKIKIKVTAFEHKELVDLLSTALYGNKKFRVSYDNEIYNNLAVKNGYCFEDALADMLLAGYKITVVDLEADGVSYSKKFVRFVGKYESAVYEICLKDFLKAASTERGYQLVEEVLSGDGDYFTGDAFFQRVVFGEEIYG